MAGPADAATDHTIAAEQALEEVPEDHRIGDVGDLEFVQAQHLGVLGHNLGSNLRQGVLFLDS